MSSTSGLDRATQVLPRVRTEQAQLPRLLAGIPERGALSLSEHLRLHGELPAVRGHGRRRDREHAEQLIRDVERSGLLGRGGAAFPLGAKMRAVAGQRARAIVLVNGVEAEPASLKDRTLLEALPHLVLDGALIAAQALGADELLVGVSEQATEAIYSVEEALAERRRSPRHGHLDGIARASVCGVPNHFVAGQETALVAHLDGGVARPTFTPPMPFERGVARRPTLVSNVETMAHLALIARFGAAWFRALGTASQPGSALVTLSGPVAYPGVYEIELGASLSSLVEAAGGTTAGVSAALIGGYGGALLEPASVQGLSLGNEQLAAVGASFGAGVVALLSEEACPVAESARVARWLAGQSARQCGPCGNGLDALAHELAQLVEGDRGGGAERLERLVGLVDGRGACRHPDGAVNLVLSALRAFTTEFAEHARNGPCESCARPAELPLPQRPPPPLRMRQAVRA